MSDDPKTNNVDEFVEAAVEKVLEKFPELEELLLPASELDNRGIMFQKAKF